MDLMVYRDNYKFIWILQTFWTIENAKKTYAGSMLYQVISFNASQLWDSKGNGIDLATSLSTIYQEFRSHLSWGFSNFEQFHWENLWIGGIPRMISMKISIQDILTFYKDIFSGVGQSPVKNRPHTIQRVYFLQNTNHWTFQSTCKRVQRWKRQSSSNGSSQDDFWT